MSKQKKVIEQVIEETQARIHAQITKCQNLIDEGKKPIPHLTAANDIKDIHEKMKYVDDYQQFLTDRMKGGKYSVAKTGQAYQDKFDLESQLRDLKNLVHVLERAR